MAVHPLFVYAMPDFMDFAFWMALAVGFLVLGLMYYPMALLSVAMFDSYTAVNPLRVVPAMAKLPLQYLVVLVVLGILFGVRTALDLALVHLPVAWEVAVYLPIEFFTFYCLIVNARILGLLYKSNAAKLGWFE
jgi:hypothetical protein